MQVECKGWVHTLMNLPMHICILFFCSFLSFYRFFLFGHLESLNSKEFFPDRYSNH